MENLPLTERPSISYQSYTTFYKTWAPKIYRFVFSIIKSEQIAQDIVQETFTRVWTNKDRITINSEGAFKSYVFTVSYHIVLKELRSQINHPEMDDYMAYCNNTLLTENTTESKLDFSEFLVTLKLAKTKLNPRQLEIFTLNKEEHYSIAEIAAKLGINEQTVRNQLSSSLKTLRKELKEFSFLFLLYFY